MFLFLELYKESFIIAQIFCQLRSCIFIMCLYMHIDWRWKVVSLEFVRTIERGAGFSTSNYNLTISIILFKITMSGLVLQSVFLMYCLSDTRWGDLLVYYSPCHFGILTTCLFWYDYFGYFGLFCNRRLGVELYSYIFILFHID